MIQVKLFDEETEIELEEKMNAFLKKVRVDDVVDIKYHVAAFPDEQDRDQVYCFTSMVLYKK